MHGEKLHKFYSSTTTVMAIKSGKMGGTCSMIGSYEKVIQNLFGPRGGQYESGPQRNFVRGLDSYGSGEGPVRVGATGGGGGQQESGSQRNFVRGSDSYGSGEDPVRVSGSSIQHVLS